MNSTLKSLIKRCQHALAERNVVTFRLLRNRVNRKRKICRAKYYEAKISHLKEGKPSLWWKEVKKLSITIPVSETLNNTTKLLQHLGSQEKAELANTINDAFLSPMSDFASLPSNFVPIQRVQDPVLDLAVAPLIVPTHSVYKKLSTLNSTKAQGPDNILAWLLKENADLLAILVSDIHNSSYRENNLPPSWKTADIVPIPKKNPPKDIKTCDQYL